MIENLSPNDIEAIAFEATKWTTGKLKEDIDNCSFKVSVTMEISKEKIDEKFKIFEEKSINILEKELDSYNKVKALNEVFD